MVTCVGPRQLGWAEGEEHGNREVKTIGPVRLSPFTDDETEAWNNEVIFQVTNSGSQTLAFNFLSDRGATSILFTDTSS